MCSASCNWAGKGENEVIKVKNTKAIHRKLTEDIIQVEMSKDTAGREGLSWSLQVPWSPEADCSWKGKQSSDQPDRRAIRKRLRTICPRRRGVIGLITNIYLTTPQTPARTTFGPSTLSLVCSNPCMHIPATTNVIQMLRYVNEVSTTCPPTQLLIPYILGLRCQVSCHKTQNQGKFKILRSDGQAEVLPQVEKDDAGELNNLIIKSLSEATKSYLPMSRLGSCMLWLLFHMVNALPLSCSRIAVIATSGCPSPNSQWPTVRAKPRWNDTCRIIWCLSLQLVY